MASKKVLEAAEELEKYEPTIVKHGSDQHASLLASGYQMTEEEAHQIIKEREANPLTHPYEVFQKAKAFLAALATAPIPIATNPGWKRTK